MDRLEPLNGRHPIRHPASVMMGAISAPIVRWSFAVALGWAALCWPWLFQGQAIPLKEQAHLRLRL